jgi:hypothetical protein
MSGSQAVVEPGKILAVKDESLIDVIMYTPLTFTSVTSGGSDKPGTSTSEMFTSSPIAKGCPEAMLTRISDGLVMYSDAGVTVCFSTMYERDTIGNLAASKSRFLLLAKDCVVRLDFALTLLSTLVPAVIAEVLETEICLGLLMLLTVTVPPVRV